MTGTPITLTNHDCDELLRYIRSKYVTQKQNARCIRNYCMSLLMLDAGLRVGEVVQLNIDDLYFLNEPKYQLRVREEIAKNHTERIIPLSKRIRQAIEAMQVHCWPPPPGCSFWFAFYQNICMKHLTTRQVERIVNAAAMKSLGRPVHPHIFRHTFASRLMRTTNARIVQELLGHEHMSSTQIYTHPNQEDLKKAIVDMEHRNDSTHPDSAPFASSPGATDRPDAVDADRDMR